MRHILGEAHREVLQQFAWSNVLVGLDFDGTLAPIVDQPERAQMGAATRELLRRVTKTYPCVIISGRSRPDVLARIAGLGVHAVVGNHGVEPWQPPDFLVGAVRNWRPILEKRLHGLRGVVIENKMYSLAVHYRKSREKKEARAAILEVAGALPDVRIIGGKQVVNIVHRTSPHKGMALERERDHFRCDTAIYVGDDDTDEDVFALDQPGRLLSIRVGASRSSLAPYYLVRQPEIDLFLGMLGDLRSGGRRQKGAS